MLLGILCWISEVQIRSCNGLVLSGSWPIKDDQGPISLTIFDLNLNSIKKFMWSHPNSPVVLPTNFLTMTQQQCCGHMCKNLMWKAALIYFPINLYYDAKSFCDLEPCCHIYIGRLHGWSSFVIVTVRQCTLSFDEWGDGVFVVHMSICNIMYWWYILARGWA